jgi:hypothetical protein
MLAQPFRLNSRWLESSMGALRLTPLLSLGTTFVHSLAKLLSDPLSTRQMFFLVATQQLVDGIAQSTFLFPPAPIEIRTIAPTSCEPHLEDIYIVVGWRLSNLNSTKAIFDDLETYICLSPVVS